MLQQNHIANAGTAGPESWFHNGFASTEDEVGLQTRGIVRNAKAEHTEMIHDIHGESQQEITAQKESLFLETAAPIVPVAITPTPLVSSLGRDTSVIEDATFKRDANIIKTAILGHRVAQEKVGNDGIEQHTQCSDRSPTPSNTDDPHGASTLAGQASRLPRAIRELLVRSSSQKPPISIDSCKTVCPQVTDEHVRAGKNETTRGIHHPLVDSGSVVSEDGAHVGFRQSSFDIGGSTTSEVGKHKTEIKHPSNATANICFDVPPIVHGGSRVRSVQHDVMGMAQGNGVSDPSRIHSKNRQDLLDITRAEKVSNPESDSSHYVARQTHGSQFACSDEAGSGGKADIDVSSAIRVSLGSILKATQQCRHHLDPRHIFGIPRTIIRTFGSEAPASVSDVDLEQGAGFIDGSSESSMSSLDVANIGVGGGDQDSHSTTSGSTSANVDSTEVNPSRVRRSGHRQRGMTSYEKSRLALVILVATANIVFLWRMGEWEVENGVVGSTAQRTGRRIARLMLV